MRFQQNRRTILRGMAASGIVGMVTACGGGSAGAGVPFFDAKRPIGLQLYMLGDGVGEDLGGTLAKVAEIGYRHVQLPGLYGMEPAEIIRLADAAGVTVTSLHVPIAPFMGENPVTLQADAGVIADTLGALGLTKAIVPIMEFPAGARPREGESFQQAIGRAVAAEGAGLWERTAETLNRKGQALRPFGISLGYHNHNMEFAQIGETSGWEILTTQTDPGLVDFELDVAWVATAGHDPVEELGKLKGRVSHLHVKDIAEGVEPNFALQTQTTSVGKGTLDWAKILPAADAAGVSFYYVEQEPPFSEPRIDAATASYEYLSRLEI